MKSDIVQVGTFSTSGHPVGWKFADSLTIDVNNKGKALYCGWTVDELRHYRSFHVDKERFARDAEKECDEYTPAELAEIASVMPDAEKLRSGAIDHPPPPEYFEGDMPMPF